MFWPLTGNLALHLYNLFINRNTTESSGSHIMRNNLKDKTFQLVENTVSNSFQISKGCTPEASFNGISPIMKDLTSEWDMVGLMDIAYHAQDIFGRWMLDMVRY